MQQDGGGFRNWDICRLVLSCLPSKDLLQMACVSKAIAEQAFKERLMRPIRLRTYEQLSSFHRFVFSGDSASRLACVRTLILALPLYKGPLSVTSRDQLARMLDGCRSLQYLEVQWYSRLIQEDPRLPGIVASLTELRGFYARRTECTSPTPELDSEPLTIYMALPSTLTLLCLPRIPAGDTAVTLLRNLATTQTRLTQLSFSTSRFAPLNASFRSVTSLHLTLAKEYPRVRDIYRAFPSARDVRIDWKSPIYLHSPSGADTAARRLAEEDCHDGNVWRSLDVLSASFEYLCIFALTCPVRRLVLRDLELGLWFWSDQAVELISRLRPRQLDVVVDCRTPMDFPVPIDPRIFVNDSGSSPYKLTHLFAKMWFQPGNRAPDTDNTIVRISSHLVLGPSAHSRLRSPQSMFRKVLSVSQVELFRLDLHDAGTIADNWHRLHTEGPTGYQRKMAQCLMHIDLFAVVRALVDCCPTLRLVVINLDAEPDDKYWRVERSGGQVAIQEVGPYTGRRLVAEEEERLFGLRE
ncbi:hypothetical protein C8Q73DRAFT_837395 [Cubamyces lactineus]|nr:hypothetical protein C8Q73DRAFT_837395 [Cubamyces lactineus]